MTATSPARQPGETTRPRRGETRQRILDAAGDLFRAHGVDGVGVDAVMRQAGLTHGGFYAHFASKEALVAEVAHTLLENAATRWDALSRGPDPDAALRGIVEPYLSPARARSSAVCPLATLGPDVSRRAAARHALDQPLRVMLDSLARCLPSGEQAPATLATMVGAVVLARLAEDEALAASILGKAMASILPEETKK